MQYFYKLFFCLFLFFSIELSAQTTHHQYAYDANGNRVVRQTVVLTPKVAGPNQFTDLPNGLTPEQAEQGITLAAEGLTLNAFPNPATEAVQVTVEATATVTVAEARLYTGNGAVATTLSQPGNTFAVPLEGLAAGNYILWLKLSNGEIKRVQVVKM